MIPFLLILGVLPGLVAHTLYPRLVTRGAGMLVAVGGAAMMAALLAATTRFWWLPEGAVDVPVVSVLLVSILIGSVAGVMLIGVFVALFGGADSVTPRPLHRVIATGLTAVASLLICPVLIDIQAGIG